MRAGDSFHRGGEYLAICYAERFAEAGAMYLGPLSGRQPRPRAGESFRGLFMADLIRKDGPWRGSTTGEFATLNYLGRFSQCRLHSEIAGRFHRGPIIAA